MTTTQHERPPVAGPGDAAPVAPPPTTVPLVVFGAHLRGELRCWQLEELHGTFLREVRTAPSYRMHLAADGLRPLVVPAPVGVPGLCLPGEEWLLPVPLVGNLLLAISAPEAVGPVALDDGREVPGVVGAVTGRERDISDPHGWRAFRSGYD